MVCISCNFIECGRASGPQNDLISRFSTCLQPPPEAKCTELVSSGSLNFATCSHHTPLTSQFVHLEIRGQNGLVYIMEAMPQASPVSHPPSTNTHTLVNRGAASAGGSAV